MEQFDKVVAAFNPKRVEDLVEGALSCVGESATWIAEFEIEDGPYIGEWAMMPTTGRWPFAWVPLSDLEVE